jgi:hypothetical protein
MALFVGPLHKDNASVTGSCSYYLNATDANTGTGVGTNEGQSFTYNLNTYGQDPNPAGGSLQNHFELTSTKDVNLTVAASNATGVCRASVGNSTGKRSRINLYRFPSSSELVVTPETQNVWGGARWSGNLDSAIIAVTSETKLNTTTFGTPTAYGKAQVTNLTDCGLVANDIGFCLKNVPPGTYQFSANLQLGAAGPSGTPGQAICNAFGVVSGTSLGATKVSQAFATNGQTTTSEDWTTLPTGLITISSFQPNVAVYITRNKTSTGNGACIIRSSNGGNTSLPALQLIPVDQPSNSALYVQGPVKSAGTGAAIPAGYVGEQIANSFSLTNAAATTVYKELTYIDLTPGVWIISGGAAVNKNGATLTDDQCIIINTTSASGSGVVFGRNFACIAPFTINGNGSATIANYLVNVVTNTRYYLNGVNYYSSGTPQWRGAMNAIRIN